MKEAVIFIFGVSVGVSVALFSSVDININSTEVQKAKTAGFCVDNDKDLQQYKFSYENQSALFATTTCSFTGVRQDIIGCTGDDFYSYQCSY